MKNLDISKIPARFVYFWWLSKVTKYFGYLIISPQQIHLFSVGNQVWDMYRDHLILVKCKIGNIYNNPFLTKEYRDKVGVVSIRDYLRSKDNRLLNIKEV